MRTLTVVLPTYNERQTIEDFSQQVLDQSAILPGWNIEVVISDGGSNDGTVEIVKKLAGRNKKIHLLQVERGLGVGIIKGHLYAVEHLHPDIMAQMDADGQVDVSVLKKMVDAIDEGYTLVLGSRFVKGGQNQLSFSRRLFSKGASVVCKVIMGTWDIAEVTNSARAFTPALFKQVNLNRLPWREKTFIIQPAFLNEAILAGAKYKEVPLIFKNRAEGYSKNKVLNYIYDIVTYSLDARLHKWGLNIPLFYITRRAKTLVKFAIVGFIGTAVDFAVFKLIIWFLHVSPPVARLLSGEVAIINNFTLNNMWTFRHRQTSNNLPIKLLTYNTIAYGGVAIASSIMLLLHSLFGDGYISILGTSLAYNNFYFFITIPPVMVWNFTVNHLVTWRNKR